MRRGVTYRGPYAAKRFNTCAVDVRSGCARLDGHRYGGRAQIADTTKQLFSLPQPVIVSRKVLQGEDARSERLELRRRKLGYETADIAAVVTCAVAVRLRCPDRPFKRLHDLLSARC